MPTYDSTDLCMKSLHVLIHGLPVMNYALVVPQALKKEFLELGTTLSSCLKDISMGGATWSRDTDYVVGNTWSHRRKYLGTHEALNIGMHNVS